MAESKPKKTASKDKSPKVFDVTHPSKNVASSTSKPVIVGHTNTMKQDPMMSPGVEEAPVEVADSQEEQSPPPLAKPKRELKIEPVTIAQETETNEQNGSEPATQEDNEEVAVSEAADSSEANAEEPAVDNSEQNEQETQEENTEENKDEGEAAVDAIVAGVNTKKDRKDQLEKEAKKAEEIQGLINSKKFYVKTHLPPGKRNLRWLIVLIIIAVIAGAGWYFAVGDGKKYWAEDPVTQTTLPSPSSSSTPQPPADEKSEPPEETVEYRNAELGVSFVHPKDWKIESVKDSEFPTRDILTLSSPTESIKTTTSDGGESDAEVFLRTKIIIENTTNPAEYASDLAALVSCSTEDVVVASANLKMVYHDLVQPDPKVSQVSLGMNNCTATGQTFSVNDQIQLPTKKNTYVIYTEYIFSAAHLQKAGTTTPEAIALAQETGITTAKSVYMAGENFVKFKELIKTFKEL